MSLETYKTGDSCFIKPGSLVLNPVTLLDIWRLQVETLKSSKIRTLHHGAFRSGALDPGSLCKP